MKGLRDFHVAVEIHQPGGVIDRVIRGRTDTKLLVKLVVLLGVLNADPLDIALIATERIPDLVGKKCGQRFDLEILPFPGQGRADRAGNCASRVCLVTDRIHCGFRPGRLAPE